MIFERPNYIHAQSNQCRDCVKKCALNYIAHHKAFQLGSAAVCAPIRTGAETKRLPIYLNLFARNWRHQPSCYFAYCRGVTCAHCCDLQMDVP